MCNRKQLRLIAKARLEAMGVEHVNKALGVGMSHTKNRNLQKTKTGRALLADYREKYQPLWLQVTVGDMAEAGHNAQLGIGSVPKYRALRK